MPKKGKIVIYGIGQGGKDAYKILSETKEIVAFCTTDKISNNCFLGCKLIQANDLNSLSFDTIYIASMYISEIRENLYNLGFNDDVIIVYETSRMLVDIRIKDACNKFPFLLADTKSTKNIEFTSLSLEPICKDIGYQDVLLLSDYLSSNGDFSGFMAARQIVQDKLAEEFSSGSSNNDILKDFLLSNLDQGNFDIVNKLLCDNKPALSINDTQIIKSLALLTNGNISEARENAKSLYQSSDFNFMKKYANKKLAIIGPCASNSNYKNEIKDFDYVINLSLNNLLVVNDINIDLTYVNAHTLNCWEGDISIFKNSNNFFVVETISTLIERDLLAGENARLMLAPFKLFNGYPNLLQRILIDILLCIPVQEIKLFNFDMWTGINTYNNSHEISFNRNIHSNRKNEHAILESLSVLHDFITQLNFMKMLYANNTISVDEVLLKVLKLSSQQYMSALSSKWIF